MEVPESNLGREEKPNTAGMPRASPAPSRNLGDDLLFGLSIPERTMRSGVSLVGGVLRETTRRLVPRAVQNSKTYSMMVQQMLDYLVEEVGGVERPASEVAQNPAQGAGPNGAAPAAGNDFLARKAVGNFLEMAWLATFHVSPLTLLALMSDIAYGSQQYLVELAEELKREGVIAPDSTITRADDLMAAISAASSTAATTLDTPPLSLSGLQDSIEQTRRAVAQIDPTCLLPQAEIARLWRDIRDTSQREHVSIGEISGAMALAGLGRLNQTMRGTLAGTRVATSMFDRHIVEHYRGALDEIARLGLYGMLRQAATPYIEAVWTNFRPERSTLTEEAVSGRLLTRLWRATFGRRCQDQQTNSDSIA